TGSVNTEDTAFWKGGSSLSRPGYDMELGSGSWIANLSDGTVVVSATFASNPTLNAWVHLTAVVDRTAGQLKTYVNGAFVSQTALGSLGSLSSTFPASIGGLYDAPNQSLVDPFQGKIDDVKVYNYALTDADVSSLYGSLSLVGWWKLDETSGSS